MEKLINHSKGIQIRTNLTGSVLESEAYRSLSPVKDLEHCDRKSFYGKAKKAEFNINGFNYIALYSYDRLIAVYSEKSKILMVSNYWNWSATTRRHEYAFLQDVFTDRVAYEIYNRLRKN